MGPEYPGLSLEASRQPYVLLDMFKHARSIPLPSAAGHWHPLVSYLNSSPRRCTGKPLLNKNLGKTGLKDAWGAGTFTGRNAQLRPGPRSYLLSVL